MVPMLNHSLFININNSITKVIIEIVIEKGLEIKIFIPLNSLVACASDSELAPKIGFNTCSGE